MTCPLGSFTYDAFTHDPDLLAVPLPAMTVPLPDLIEPAQMPAVAVPAERDHEPLVRVTHPRICVLAPYLQAGFPHALADAFVRSGVADRLRAAADSLPDDFGLAVFDAWRPLSLQRALYDAAYTDPSLPAGFVAAPSTDPTTPPPHLTGGTVDVTLTWQQYPLALGSSFDDFTDAAHAASCEPFPGRARDLRRLLHATMRHHGFIVLDREWWHYEIGTRRWAAITGAPAWYGAADGALTEPRVADMNRIVPTVQLRHDDNNSRPCC